MGEYCQHFAILKVLNGEIFAVLIFFCSLYDSTQYQARENVRLYDFSSFFNTISISKIFTFTVVICTHFLCSEMFYMFRQHPHKGFQHILIASDFYFTLIALLSLDDLHTYMYDC